MKHLLLSLLFLITLPLVFANHGLQIYPSSATMKAGSSLRFTVVAQDSDGTMYTPQNVNWKTYPGSIGYDGNYTAPSQGGTYQITATWNRYKAVATVYVKQAQPSISKIVIHPYNPTVAVNNYQQFKALAYDSYGRKVKFYPQWWTDGGTINNAGYYTAGHRPGRYTVWVKDTHSGVQASTYVTVIREVVQPNPGYGLSKIVIAPRNKQISVNASLQFQAYGYDKYDRQVNFSPKWWTDNGGSITDSGYYTAGYRPGHYTVWVKDAYSGVQASTTVEVIRGTIPPHYPPSSDGKIDVARWHIDDGNVFQRPQAEITVKVYGSGLQKAVLYGIFRNDRETEVETKSCSNGDQVHFKEKFAHEIYWLEVRLYDSYDNVIAKYRARAK